MRERSSYTCAECGQTYESGWDEEDATAELAATFPLQDKTACDVVCDDCYKKIMAEIFQ